MDQSNASDAEFEQFVCTVKTYYSQRYGHLLTLDEWRTLLSCLFRPNNQQLLRYTYNCLNGVVSKLFANAKKCMETLPSMDDYPGMSGPYIDHGVVLARNGLDTTPRNCGMMAKKWRGLVCFKSKVLNAVYTDPHFKVGTNNEIHLVRARFDAKRDHLILHYYGIDHLLFTNELVLFIRHLRIPNSGPCPLTSLFVSPRGTIRYGELPRPARKSDGSKDVASNDDDASNDDASDEPSAAKGPPELVSRKRATPERASSDSDSERIERAESDAKRARSPKHVVRCVSNTADAKNSNVQRDANTTSLPVGALSDDDADPDYECSESEDDNDTIFAHNWNSYRDIDDDDDDGGAELSSATRIEDENTRAFRMTSKNGFLHLKVPRRFGGNTLWMSMLVHVSQIPELAEKGVLPQKFGDYFKNTLQHVSGDSGSMSNNFVGVRTDEHRGEAIVTSEMLASMADVGMLGDEIKRWRRK